MQRKATIKLNSFKTAYIASVVLMTVLISKTYFFGVVNRSFFQYIYYILVFLGAFLHGMKKKMPGSQIVAAAPFVALIAVNILIYHNDMAVANVNLALGNALMFICVALTTVFIKREQYTKLYIKIICVICIISIPCCVLANTVPDIARTFCQPGYDWKTPVGYSWFYTWGWNGTIFRRNSGMFWEPGAFQAYIIIAMLFLLYNMDADGIKNRKLVFFLLLATLLSTQSTTGYILVIMLIFAYWDNIRSFFGNSNKVIRKAIVIVIAGTSVYLIISSGNISGKLLNPNSVSASVRFMDVIGGLRLIIRGGLIGLGETSQRDIMRIMFSVSRNDSVGLFSMTYIYGIIFGIIYSYLMIKGAIKLFQSKNPGKNIVLCLILVIIHMTEGLWNLPVFLIIPFYGMISRGGI